MRFFYAILIIFVFFTYNIIYAAGIQFCVDSQKATEKEDWDECIRLLTLCIDSKELSTHNLVVAYNNRGTALLAKEENQKAFEDFNKALELLPTYYISMTNRGIAYYRLKMYDDALNDYNKVIKLTPDKNNLANTLENRGRLFLDKKAYDKALIDFDKAIKMTPSIGGRYSSKAEALLGLGRLEDALEYAEKGVKISPNSSFTNRIYKMVKEKNKK